LFGDQRVAEHLLDVCPHFIVGFGQTDTARSVAAKLFEFALATPTGVDLTLDDPNRSGHGCERSVNVGFREDGSADGDGGAEALQHGFGLILVDVHVSVVPLSACFGNLSSITHTATSRLR